MRIGVFDSGVGGFSVLQSIQTYLGVRAEIRYFYCCDQANFPYGTKDEAKVVEVAQDVCRRFVAAAELDLLIIACGTASTAVLPAVRASVACPVIGVVPAVKPAAAASRTRHIAVLATEAPARRPYLHHLISEFAEGCKVTVVGSAVLVEMAEAKIRGKEAAFNQIAQELEPIFADQNLQVDVVVLGCTHFPLLVPELKAVAPWPVLWMDSGEAVARRVASLMATVPEKHSNFSITESCGFTTGRSEELWPDCLPDYVAALGLTRWMHLP